MTTNQLVKVDRTNGLAKSTPYTEALRTFIENQRADCTKATYWSNLKGFGAWLDKPVETVTIADVVDYKAHLEAKDLSAGTIANKLSSLRQFFGFLKDHGLIAHNPTAGVKSPKIDDRTSKGILTEAQAGKLLQSIDTGTIGGKRDLAIIALMLVNGLREIEITRAKVRDLGQVDEFEVLAVTGKGGRIREAKLRADVKAVIDAYLAARAHPASGQALFVGHNGKAKARMTTRTIRAMVDRRLEAVGLKREGISGHSFRHTAVTLSILNGATLVQAQELAGHIDPKVTMRYFHNLDRLRDSAVDLNPIKVA